MKAERRDQLERQVQLLKAWRASGLGLRAYCGQHGLHYPQLRAWVGFERHWQGLLVESKCVPERPVSHDAFVEVCPRQQTLPSPRKAQVQLVLHAPGGWRVQADLSLDASAAWLREVLK